MELSWFSLPDTSRLRLAAWAAGGGLILAGALCPAIETDQTVALAETFAVAHGQLDNLAGHFGGQGRMLAGADLGADFRGAGGAQCGWNRCGCGCNR